MVPPSLFQRAFENSRDAILIGKDGLHVFTNQAYLDMFGYSGAEMLTRQPVLSLVAPAERPHIAAMIVALAQGDETPVDFSTRGLRSDGSEFNLEVRSSIIHLDGEVYFLAFLRDITEKSLSEQAMREIEEHYQQFFENNPIPMWVYHLETLAFLAVNESAVVHYGYSREEFLSMTIADIRPPEDVPALLENVSQVSDGLDEAGIWRHCKKNGEVIDVEIISHTLIFNHQRAEMVLANDVTIREEARRSVRDSESRLRFITGAIADMVIQISQDQSITYASPSVQRCLGYTADEFLGMKMLDFVFPEDLPQVLSAGRAAINQRRGDLMQEYRCRHRAGHYLWIESNANLLYDAQGEFSGAIFASRDITGRRQSMVDLKEAHDHLRAAYDTTIEGWAQALDLRDKETEGHSRRVAKMTVRLARNMGIDGDALDQVYRGALLHDIGKLAIPDTILFKPGPLTPKEWEIMAGHPEVAFRMLSHIPYLARALEIPYCHHEWWDGSGYPRGLRGKEIPLAGRIFAVVDVWDALLSDRPYRPAWPLQKVLEHIQKQAGTHFDPEIVALFLRLHADRALADTGSL